MINVYSEIGKLRKVLVHRPGNELLQVHPFHLNEMLFEDTPFLPYAQEEHDAFTSILRNHGVDVLDIRDLFQDAMRDPDGRKEFTQEFLAASNVPSISLNEAIMGWYEGLTVEDFVESVFCGIRRDAEPFASDLSLGGLTYKEDLFLVQPLPNSYFARDSSINVGDGVVLSHMGKEARRREPLLLKFIHQYSTEFKENPTCDFYGMQYPYGIEGGDFLVLSDKAVCIGCSERTQPGAIEKVASSLFTRGFESVFAIEMPRGREAMHLDGMLTMVDTETFMYNPFLSGSVNVFKLTQGPSSDAGTPSIKCSATDSDWGKVVADALNTSAVKLIPCGGGDAIAGMWEMWNLGSNVLALEPGNVVGYDRNPISLDLLDKAGVTVHTFKGSELSRGRGGARCMSMPIYRDSL